MTLGSDFAGVTDLTWNLATVTGRTALAEAILRRLTTTRGRLVTDPLYGYNVRALIGSHVSPSTVEQKVLEQVFAEQEVEDASCTVAYSATGILQINITVTDGDGPFSLTLIQSDVTLEALINGAAYWGALDG